MPAYPRKLKIACVQAYARVPASVRVRKRRRVRVCVCACRRALYTSHSQQAAILNKGQLLLRTLQVQSHGFTYKHARLFAHGTNGNVIALVEPDR